MTKANHYSSDMTMREYYAAHAPQDIVEFKNPETAYDFIGAKAPKNNLQIIQISMKVQAKLAFMYADAMLEAAEAKHDPST